MFSLDNWRVTTIPVSEVPKGVISVHQVHGSTVVSVEEVAAPTCEADAIYTTTFRQPIAVRGADCLPLLLWNEERVLLAHISRFNLIKNILHEIERHFSPSIAAGVFIGPHICPVHFTFEYMTNELQRFCQQFPAAVRQLRENISIDLQIPVRAWLASHNSVLPTTVDGRCTFATPALASYRRWRQERSNDALPFNATVAWHQSSNTIWQET